VFQEINTADLSADHHWFLEEGLQTQSFFLWFQEDHVAHDLLFLTVLD